MQFYYIRKLKETKPQQPPIVKPLKVNYIRKLKETKPQRSNLDKAKRDNYIRKLKETKPQPCINKLCGIKLLYQKIKRNQTTTPYP